MTQVEIEDQLRRIAKSGECDSAYLRLNEDGNFEVYRYYSGEEESIEHLATCSDIGSALADALNEIARLDN